MRGCVGVTVWWTGGGGSIRCGGTTERRPVFALRLWWLVWARTGVRPGVAATTVAVVLAGAGAVAGRAGAVDGGTVAVAAGVVAAAFVAGRACSVTDPHAATAPAPEVRTNASATVV